MAKHFHKSLKQMEKARPVDPMSLAALPRQELANRLQTAEAQRDDALRQLQSRANLVQTIARVDDLTLTLERAVEQLQKAGKIIVQLKLVSEYQEQE